MENKSKIIICDFGILSHRSIFSTVRNSTVPATYVCLSSIIGCLKRIGVNKEDKVIIAIDARNSWRKDYEISYKADRSQKRKESPIDWDKEYKNINWLLEKLDLATNFHNILLPRCEADDIQACFLGQTYIAAPFKNSEDRKIKQLKIGDKVYSYNLEKNKIELSTVVKTHKRIVNNIKIIHFDNKTKVKVTENHRFYSTKNKWIAVRDLKIGDEIYYLNSSHKNNRYVFLLPKSKNAHNSYRIGYLCGAIEGDGHLNIKRNNIQFNINDLDFVKRLQTYMQILFNYKLTYSKENKTYRILVGNKLIFDMIKNYIDNKEFQNKSFNKGFIAGMFDSEGCLQQNKTQLAMNISNTNKQLIDFISSKLQVEYTITTAQNYRKDGKAYKLLYLIRIHKQSEIIKFLTIYKPAIIRKYPNFKLYAKYLHNGRKIVKIEDKINTSRKFQVYNLKVEPNNNYFAHNLLVHNCACRYYKNNEVILLTYDSDMNQLTSYGNVKIFSPMTKRYKIMPKNYNAQKDILKKVNKEAADNLINPILSEQAFNNRLKCVDLLHLPANIETQIIAELDNLQEKENNLELLPYPTLRARFNQIYGEGSESYEKSVKYYERKEKAKKKKKALKKRRKIDDNKRI